MKKFQNVLIAGALVLISVVSFAAAKKNLSGSLYVSTSSTVPTLSNSFQITGSISTISSANLTETVTGAQVEVIGNSATYFLYDFDGTNFHALYSTTL